jgi:hypothetical protein
MIICVKKKMQKPLDHSFECYGKVGRLFLSRTIFWAYTVFHGKHFFLLLQVNPKKKHFILVLHGFIGPTPRMLGQLL